MPFADQIAVPTGDFDHQIGASIGACLASEARARAHARRLIEHVFFRVLGFAATVKAFTDDYVASRARADSSTCMIDIDVMGSS